MLVVAQISDLHFRHTDPDQLARIDAVMTYLNDRCGGASAIDALLVTGDLTDEGLPGQYDEAAEHVVTDIPTLTLLGNHDDRVAYHGSTAPVNTSLLLDGLLLLGLDSSIPGSPSGELTETTLAWASEQIAAAGDVPVVVAFHHPPVDVGMRFMDTIRQLEPSGFETFVRRHPTITGLVCGHIHSPGVTTFAGVPLVTAPGVSSTLNLDFEGDDVLNDTQPPGIAFHLVDATGRLTTHFRSVVV
ncbi:3',5'-cyclic adenosine monophosphate phosphodiesterase CpdA [Gordonia spumicola]|uniref:3',5'-cyclic adenosine monophosphate phosphodiesterase CpdA n=1 Tax=Gordonia spumicola TaxID=589161 RepID=A0A7I9V8Y0_9ACTN|nr:metallophosphoesterase [Gordonia spumicola]GEE01702.1 3',5'-cyclic adenosine monophosphate phosphodiesterase CpdA [Gordonia spumicola]